MRGAAIATSRVGIDGDDLIRQRTGDGCPVQPDIEASQINSVQFYIEGAYGHTLANAINGDLFKLAPQSLQITIDS